MVFLLLDQSNLIILDTSEIFINLLIILSKLFVIFLMETLKDIDFLEEILNSSLVFGFLPILSFFLIILKVPKFFKFKSPVFIFLTKIKISFMIFLKDLNLNQT